MILEEAAKEYERSEITIVFIHDRVNNSFTNIFSVAEMCPYEQTSSNQIVDESSNKVIPMKRLSLDKNRTIYISRIFDKNPIESIYFYRGKANKRVVNIGGENITISTVCSKLKEDPENEVPVVIPSYLHKETTLGSILPKRKVSMRVCSLMDLDSATRRIFTDNEFIKVNEFIKKVLLIDLIKYSEYVGSILLCFSNPFLRSIEESLTKLENQILIQLFERKGKTIEGGKMEIFDERINGNGFSICKKIDKPQMFIDIPCSPQKVSLKIFDKCGNLVEISSGHFLKDIKIDVGITEAKRRVVVSDNNSTIKTFEVPTVSYEKGYKNFIEQQKQTVQSRLYEGEKIRELDTLEEKRIFIYFPGNRHDSKKYAQEVIRELLGKARERCVICDPYLSSKDVIDYALFAKTANIEVRLISSAEFLLKKVSDLSNVIQGDLLNNTIENITRQDKTMKISCHVLAGREKSPLHDRFIIVDGEVYLLGSSLNEFGTRATTLFKAPDPRPLIRQADTWWANDKDSKSIGSWLDNHEEEGKIE